MAHSEQGPKALGRDTHRFVELSGRIIHPRFNHDTYNHYNPEYHVAGKPSVPKREDMRIGLREAMEATDGDAEPDFDPSILDWEGLTDDPTEVSSGQRFISEIDPRRV